MYGETFYGRNTAQPIFSFQVHVFANEGIRQVKDFTFREIHIQFVLLTVSYWVSAMNEQSLWIHISQLWGGGGGVEGGRNSFCLEDRRIKPLAHNRLVRPYQLEESIANLRSVWCTSSFLLAHLSRRLIGELLGKVGLRRPSSVSLSSVVHTL